MSFCPVFVFVLLLSQKGRDLTQSYDKKPLHQQNNLKRNVTSPNRRQNFDYMSRLRTDLGRSVGVTTATLIVWLNMFDRSQPSH